MNSLLVTFVNESEAISTVIWFQVLVSNTYS